MQIEINQQRMTKGKYSFKSVNDVEYTVDTGLPELILADNSVIIFPGLEMFAILVGNTKMCVNNKFDEDFMHKFLIKQEDIDASKYTFEAKPLDSIDIFKITSDIFLPIIAPVEDNIYMYRLYLE